MMIDGGDGGGCGGSGSGEDDVMMMMMTTTMTTTKGSRGLGDGGGEGRPTMNVTNIAKLQFFSISSRRIPIASLICSCLYHLPTDATRGMTSFRKKNQFIGIIYALPLCTRCAESSIR